MAINITTTGNIIKIDYGGSKIQYFDSNKTPYFLEIDPTTLFVSFQVEHFILFSQPLSQVTINGTIPASVSAFETALNAMPYGLLFDKLDPLVIIGFMSTSTTANVKRITALGNNPDVDGASLPEHIWSGGGLYPWMTAATSLEVVSSSVQDVSSGTGTASISINFLDANYVESNVTVSLNGTTPVAISGTWFRINLALIMTKGSGALATRAVNIGDITIRDAGGGTTRAIIPAGRGITRQCVYTIPAGYTGQIISLYIGFNRGTGGVTKFLTASTYVQTSTGIARIPLDIGCDGEPYRHDGIPGIIVPEKTDFALEIESVSSDNSDVSGAFLGILVKNDILSRLSYP